MSLRIPYKGYVINAASYTLATGGFKANGSIEDHQGIDIDDNLITDHNTTHSTKEEADLAFINYAKHKIDSLVP